MLIRTVSLALFVLSVGPPATASAAGEPLQLRTAIISPRYCAGDDEVGTLHLVVRMELVNTTAHTLIVFRSPVLTQLITSSPADPTLKPFALSLMTVTEGLTTIRSEWPSPSFALLGPAGRFAAKATVAIPVKRNAQSRFPGLAAGEHLLQVRASMWPDTPHNAKRVAELWRSHGQLWSAPLLSSPMRFTVDTSATFRDCDAR